MMHYQLEVITIPVTDVDRAKEFYSSGLGFDVDVDYAPTEDFRVVQLTPPGAACSVQIGTGLTEAVPGSVRNTYLVVTDLEAAADELRARGINVSGPEHKEPAEMWAGGLADGLDQERRDYASFLRVSDPDGNTWVIQERGHR
jgi:catechol 2,3-dioxygenase-like lactoylglutathione lyase family enzyme